MIVIRAFYRRRTDGPLIEAIVPLDVDDSTTTHDIEQRVLTELGVPYSALAYPLTRRCAGFAASRNRACLQFLDLTVPRCMYHRGDGARRPSTLTKEQLAVSVRSWARNRVYCAYARVHGMTIAQRWQADHYNTGAFDAWTARSKLIFARIHPEAVSRSGSVTDLTTWFAWLDALTPDTMVQREFL